MKDGSYRHEKRKVAEELYAANKASCFMREDYGNPYEYAALEKLHNFIEKRIKETSRISED